MKRHSQETGEAGNPASLINQYCPCNMALHVREMWPCCPLKPAICRAKGWTKNAVCGMLGNMQSESTISPGRWQDGDAGNMNLGVGLTQWTKATKLYDWAAKNNLYPLDMDTQLKRILFEVTTTDPNEIQYTPKSPQYPLTFQQFTKSTQTPYDLACAFLHCYEKPKNSQQDATRGAQATEWFNALS